MSLWARFLSRMKPALAPPPLPVVTIAEKPRPRRYVYPVPFTSQEELLRGDRPHETRDGWEVIYRKGSAMFVSVLEAPHFRDVLRALKRTGVEVKPMEIVDIKRIKGL